VGVRSSNLLGSTILKLWILTRPQSAFRVQNMDGQWQYFATPKIPNLAGAITKGHATGPQAVHYNWIDTILFETGFRSVVFHGP